MKNPINICLSFDEKYAQHAAVTMVSLKLLKVTCCLLLPCNGITSGLLVSLLIDFLLI